MAMETDFQLFSSDLDGTLLGDEAATNLFKQVWEQLPQAKRPMLCFNTGRLLDDVLQLVKAAVLPQPDYIITGVGTTIYDFGEQCVLSAFTEILEDGWDLERVESTIVAFSDQLTKQPTHYQHEYKSSWFWDDATAEQVDALNQAMEANGLEVHIVYSSNRHLDVLPKAANKGNALHWLARYLDIPLTQVLVAGDSGNDSAMFNLRDVHGIVVGNAQPELRELVVNSRHYQAPQNDICAFAVLSGLQHYGLLDTIELPSQQVETVLLYETLRVSGDDDIDTLTSEQIATIRRGYHKAIEALKKTCTPLGFSACSLADNEVIGTDENYRSVWARDGAIALIGSLPLTDRDDEIHQCQRHTLETLLAHLSPNGQFPANVRIDDESPDYSGVGGIASIDSGLWVIIAFYAYVSQTRDLDFLRRYRHQLQDAMDWLSAHDSNNDALLEIPEAGDWTDLFGRSYNVLYDEVLWYRCNLCFGRLLGMLGQAQQAADYLRWASRIKRKIRANFWPTTQQQFYQNTSFADRQFSIGDARYLISQITPFGFSWRCDTFGNILAFLYNVTDMQQASQTFRFLWGVGVNEPYPISNLYPVVTSGDSDWRPYYAVNMLNLPHHYHNGGIWPLVGGHWVRFINKLELRELALQELHRLTELNKLGVLHEWEFNEWFHGTTGRPMGKAYQAWSASEFIRTCHALNVVA